MKSIRIGNDIAVTWSLYKEGQPYSLEGMAVRLYLNHALGRSEIGSFKVSGNVVAWTFEGKDQKHTGRYSLELVVNEGESGMVSVDKIDFVRLTPVTPCCEGEDDENVVTEHVDLTSSVDFAPVIIKEGGSGLQYAVERTVYPTKMVYPDDEYDYEITDEQREYNRKTIAEYHFPFLSYEGTFLHPVAARSNEEGHYVDFNTVLNRNGELESYTITISSNGDAVAVIGPIQTGGSSATPSDMNSDFNNDF